MKNTVSPSNISSKLTRGRLLEKKIITRSIIRMRFANEEIVDLIRPGHFINIRVADSVSPLLRRPFSVFRVNKKLMWFEILFQIIGKGTQLLANTQIGDEVDLFGPLGNSFLMPKKLDFGVLVAGGLGIAPLFALTQELVKINVPIVLFWGNRTKDAFAVVSEFEKLGVEVHLATDDGSFAFKGTVIDLLNTKIENFHKSIVEIFACGPNPMLKTLKKISQNHNILCQVSLETMMACGFGVCKGCNVISESDSDEYKYVCQHGPVFDSMEIEFGD